MRACWEGEMEGRLATSMEIVRYFEIVSIGFFQYFRYNLLATMQYLEISDQI